MEAAEKAVATDSNKLLINKVIFAIMALRLLQPESIIFFYQKCELSLLNSSAPEVTRT